MMNMQFEQQIANQIELVNDMMFFNDLSFTKMVEPNLSNLTQWSPNTFRRFNDIVAGCYAHSLAIDQMSGDDCIDSYGNTLELKLAILSSNNYTVQGDTVMANSKSNLTSQVCARFSVYDGTDSNHHNKDTALILYSADHKQFITGFMLSGDIVKDVLNQGQENTKRAISLSRFISDGYEFSSQVPHIGWERYYETLWYYTAAKEGKLSHEDSFLAFHNWVKLGDERLLERL